jgi:hypothetical protein
MDDREITKVPRAKDWVFAFAYGATLILADLILGTARVVGVFSRPTRRFLRGRKGR